LVLSLTKIKFENFIKKSGKNTLNLSVKGDKMDKIIKIIAEELNIKPAQVENTIRLIDEGNTIPFIARYRKEVTGGLSDEILRTFGERLNYLRNLEKRKEEVTNSINEQGKLTEEITKDLENAITLAEVEDIYRPYKQKKKTRATVAKAKGLEPLAEIILKQEEKRDITKIAEEYINEGKEVKTPEEAICGALDIIAEMISDNPEYRKLIKKIIYSKGVIKTIATKPEEKSAYEMYYDFSENVNKLPSHRILAINRGEKEEFLKVKIEKEEEIILEKIEKDIIKGETQFTNYLKDTIQDSFKRLIEPSIDREIRSDLTEKAEEQAIKVFGKNAKQLLLGAPIKGITVMGFDPAYRTGCKIAIIDETGKVLDITTVYPTEPQNDVEGAEKELVKLINKNNVNMIAIGNGTASRESELFVSEMIKKCDHEVLYTIVSEAGASVYSASKLATEEYPDINVSIRGAISIARRLQDPLAEFVKIDPKSIGVGQYQHDVNQKKLEESLAGVVEDSVNKVGVDVNTATASLLSYVSGINKTIAKNIVKYRDENGKISTRKELLKVPKLGKVAFEQCAGFIRIPDGKNPLENTAVHPESYETAENLLQTIGYKVEDLKDKEKIAEFRKKLSCLNLEKTSKELNIGEMTLKDIIEELSKPGRDPREDMPKPILRQDVLKFEDLKEGMILTGTVRNVIDFGAFVDIGVKHDGLVHISELSEKFVKNPSDIVAVGDIVKVKVIGIDSERQKVKLSMKIG
jgi:RNA binding S1